MSLPRFQTGNPFSAEPSPSGHKGLKKGVYLVPSLFTALNILAGFFSLMETMTGDRLLGTGDATTHFDYAAMAIGWALLFDILDGRVARMTKTTTEIGIQLDSLADIVSFGLAPAMLVFAWGYGTALESWGNIHQLAWFLSFMYVICGGFRLAGFNVPASRARPPGEGAQKDGKKSIVGLPT